MQVFVGQPQTVGVHNRGRQRRGEIDRVWPVGVADEFVQWVGVGVGALLHTGKTVEFKQVVGEVDRLGLAMN